MSLCLGALICIVLFIFVCCIVCVRKEEVVDFGGCWGSKRGNSCCWCVRSREKVVVVVVCVCVYTINW